MALCLTVLFLVFGSCFFCLAQSQAQVDMTQRNVLILHSYEANTPVFMRADSGISTALQAGGIPSLNQYFESLDLRRNPSPEHRRMLVEQMRTRYGHRKIDIIITMYPEALDFVLNDCRDVLPDAPILAIVLPVGFELPKTDRRIIGHFAKLDILGTLDIVMKLFPGTKRVYVVGGAHGVDWKVEAQARRDLKHLENRLEFIYMSHMPFEQMQMAISSAPSDSIVLTLAFSQDVNGRMYTAPIVNQRLSRVSTAPIFGIFEHTLGYGITGGSLVNFELIGKKAGQLAMDILGSGNVMEIIPDVMDVPPVPMFDWRQLSRWNLEEDALPKGSIVINRETTLWDFKYYIIGGIVVLLAQTLLVIGLLVQKRRKETAEEDLRQKTDELNQFFNVTLDLLGIANTDGYFVRVNPAMEKTLGYPGEELMSRPFLEFVHPDDQDRTGRAFSVLTSQEKVLSFENRYRCKDGTYRWLQWNSAPAGSMVYAAARDVTAHKQVEKDLRENEEILRRRNRYIETVFENAPIGFAVHTIDDGVGRYVSARFEEIYGVQRGVIDSHYTFFDRVWPNHPELREEIKRRVAADIASGDSRRMRWENIPVPLRTGETRYITATNIPVPDQNLMVSTVQDVTEQKKAVDALLTSEAKYRSLYESMMDGYTVVGMDGRI